MQVHATTKCRPTDGCGKFRQTEGLASKCNVQQCAGEEKPTSYGQQSCIGRLHDALVALNEDPRTQETLYPGSLDYGKTTNFSLT